MSARIQKNALNRVGYSVTGLTAQLPLRGVLGPIRFVALSTACLVSCPNSSGAQTATDSKRILAQALFERGRNDFEKGDIAAACQKLLESKNLDVAPGTLLNLALCHEVQHKTASAWAEYKEVVALSRATKDEERAVLAAERAQLLEPKLSYVTLRVHPQFATTDLVITLDSVPLGRGAWNTALPIDPGSHVVLAKVTQHRDWQSSFEIVGDGQQIVVTISETALTPLATKRPRSAIDVGSSSGSAKRIGIGMVGLGAASMIAGGYFGLRARSSWQERNRHCGSTGCDSTAVEAWRDAKRFSTLADLTFALGIAGVGAGIYLIFSSKESTADNRLLGIHASASSVGMDFSGPL